MRLDAILPAGFEARPSGGNEYDRRVCAGLSAAGWDVRITIIEGPWLPPGPHLRHDLAAALDALPDGATVLLDGLIAAPAAAVLHPRAERLRLAVLLHMPLSTAIGHGIDDAARTSEHAVLTAAAVIVVTSRWARDRLVALGHPKERIVVATPGVDPAPHRFGEADPATPRLLCVGAVAAHKGQDVLVEALAAVRDRAWICELVGPLDQDPVFVRGLRNAVAASGLGDRIELVGPLARADLDDVYAQADLLLHPTHGETYGMVVTEALAHGIPVIASAVGGVPEALGRDPEGNLPGLLMSPDQPDAWSHELGRWLDDSQHRRRLRASAVLRSTTLSRWDETTTTLISALGPPDRTSLS